MRTLSRPWNIFIKVASIALVCFQMYTAAFGVLGDMLQRSIHLTFVLGLSFLLKPAIKGKKETRVPFYDIIFSITAVCACLYIVYINDIILYDPLIWLGPLDKFFAIALVLLILEAGRRFVGWIFIILSGVFFVYALYGPYFPGIWGHQGFPLDLILQTMYHGSIGIWSTMAGISATMLAMFGIFGAMLSETGGAETFVKIGQRTVGNSIGGEGKVSLISSGLFGVISGSAIANVIATGTFTIPMMKKAGYSAEWSAATSALGATGGQIMPPIMGSGAFIMSQLIGVSYGRIAVSAIFPSVLFYMAGLLSIHYVSLKLGIGVEKRTKPEVDRREYITICAPLLIFIIMIVQMFAIDISAFYATVIGFIVYIVLYRKTNQSLAANAGYAVEKAGNICVSATTSILSMTSLLISAQIVITLVQFTGFGLKMSNLIVEIGQNNVFLCLLLSMFICVLLGMGLPTTAAYILASSVLVPPLAQIGIPIQVGHFFVFYFAVLSTITPPVCAAVFISSGIAESDWLKTGIIACLMALPIFIVPFAFVYCNGLLLVPGEPIGYVIYAFITAVLGVVSISIGVAGFNRRLLKMWERIGCIAAGVVMVTPGVIPATVAAVSFLILFLMTRKKAGLAKQQ